jgi:hypothetical protein
MIFDLTLANYTGVIITNALRSHRPKAKGSQHGE